MALYGTVPLGTETPIEMMGPLKVMGAKHEGFNHP
jgi:hypothetical protein